MKPTLNLASRTYLNRRAVMATYLIVSLVLVAVLAFNLLYFVRSHNQAGQLRERLAELEQQRLGSEQAASGYSPAAQRELEKHIAFGNELLLKDSFRWTELLERLEDMVPGGVRIEGLQPDYKQRSLKVTGLARNVGLLQRFIDQLIESPHFEDVFLMRQASIERKQDLGRSLEAIQFSIVLNGAF